MTILRTGKSLRAARSLRNATMVSPAHTSTTDRSSRKCDRINATMRSIEAAQKSWIALYDKYADGKLEREFFLNEKKQYDADMEKMEEELAALRQAQEEEEAEQEGSQRKADQAMAFLEEKELTEDMKEKLIEKVIVYPGDRIEIVWKFEGHLNN